MIKNILKEAFILKQNGFYKHALETFYKAMEIDNSSSELLLEIAKLYYLMNDEERALDYIEEILNKEPAHVNCLKLLKEIFINKNNIEDAIKTSKNIYAISKNPKDLECLLELLNSQKRYEELFNYEQENLSHKSLYEMSLAKLFTSNISTAESCINKALEVEQNEKYLLLKSKILFKQNRIEECSDIIKNISLDYEDADMINFVGLVKQYEFDFDNAIKLFTHAIKLAPKNDEYYYNCASTYFKKGDKLMAKKYYNLSISINPENPNYHFALANLYYSERNYKRAMEELDFDFFEANLLKSIILYDTGYLALAKKELDKLILERPEDIIVQEYTNRIAEELKI